MKKIFPAIIISLCFSALVITQMAINGQKSNASKSQGQKEKFTAFESTFQNLSLETTKGTKLKLKNVKQPIVILNFWASWCQPCLSEFATLKKFINKFSDEKVLVIGINNDDEEPKRAIKKTEKDLKLNFESVMDAESVITSKFFISRIPSSIIFHKGKVIQFETEEYDFMNKDFVKKIEKLLKKK